MTDLTVQVLGVPEVRFQEQRLAFRSRKALALLIYLAVEPGTHSREKLVDLLWSQNDFQQGRVSLRTALSQVRQALRATGSPGIATTNDLVRLDVACPLQLDLTLITAALLPEATDAEWQTAVAASRGPFLEGFSLADASGFEEWASWQRQHWHAQIERVFQRLTTYHLDRGEAEQALQTAGPWVAHAPLNESAYRCLMEAQARSGNRTAALQTFQQCERLLRAELDIAPGAEIALLAARIRQGPLRKPAHAPSLPAIPGQVRLPFVGRSAAYHELVTSLRTAVQGATRVTAVIGAAGMGKSHLVETFLEGVQFDQSGVDVLRGRAYEMGGHLPYQPLVAAFRARLEEENAPEDLLDDVWLAELSQLLPELRARYPDLPMPLTGGADFMRARLFEAFVQLGRALAARQPLILFLDDWQWAESSSLEMLRYLIQSWSDHKTPLLLVLTLRQGALLATPALRDWLAGIERALPLIRLGLGELTAADVERYVRHTATAGSAAPEPVAEDAIQQMGRWLFRDTGGQPFFLHERVKMLVDEGTLRQVAGDGRATFDIPTAWQQLQDRQLPLPTTVREALLVRQDRLSQTARSLLWASAVLGRDCTFERLCQVAGVSEADGLPALGELLVSRLMLENAAARRPYTFGHDYIREVAYTEAGEARRRLFHRRALAALAQADAPPAELAFHALAAQLGDPALRYAIAAGDAARKAHAYAEALTHYDQARLLLLEERVVKVDTAVIQHLYLQIGRVLELRNQFDQALATYQQMIELAAQFADERIRLASLTAQCIVHATQTPLYDMAKARALADEALVLARRLGDKAIEAKVLWGLLLVESWGGGDDHKGLAYGLRSLELARELELNEQMGFTYQDIANVYRNLNQLADAKRAVQEALAIWQDTGNLPMLIDAYTMQHWNYFLTGELNGSLPFVEEALRLSRSINHPWSQVVSLGFLAQALIELGDAGRAAEALHERERVTAAVESGFHITFQYLIDTGWLNLALSLGAWEDARPLGERLYENRHAIFPIFLSHMMSGVIQIKILEGNLGQAQEIWDEIAPTATLHWPATELYLLLAQNQVQRALDRAQTLARQLRQAGLLVYLPEVLWLQGKAWMRRRHWEQARETLTEALEISRLNGERRLRWRILSSLSDVAQAQGEADEAERFRVMGQEIVTYLVDHIATDALRTAFLSGPDVRAIVAAA